MNTENNLPEELLEQIAAYLDGDMPSEQRAEFEKRLETDETLRLEMAGWQETVRATREWLQSEAPGEERVETLEIPTLIRHSEQQRSVIASEAWQSRHWNASLRSPHPGPSQTQGPGFAMTERGLWPYFWRIAGAIAIFIAGFALGQLLSSFESSSFSPENRPGVTTGVDVQIPQETAAPPRDDSRETDTAIDIQETDREPVQVVQAPRGRRFVDEKGRIVIETSLKESGSRAIWVVDGSFQLERPTENN